MLERIDDEFVGFTAGCAVTDGGERDVKAFSQCGDGRDAARPVTTRLMRINGFGGQQFAGGVDDRDLAAGTDTRVDAHGDVLAGRGGQQQILEVLAEDTNGFFFGTFAQLADQIKLQMQGELDAPSPAHGVVEPFVCGAVLLFDAEAIGDALLAWVGCGRECFLFFLFQFAIEHQ